MTQLNTKAFRVVKKHERNHEPKQKIPKAYELLVGKRVVCVQKGNIKLIGTLHSIEQGVLLFLNSEITYAFMQGDNAWLDENIQTTFVDRTAVQMMYEVK